MRKEMMQMPLTMANSGEKHTIRKIGGVEDTKRFLTNLGFTEGAEIEIVSAVAGNMIISVRDSRVAINNDMAKKIMV